MKAFLLKLAIFSSLVFIFVFLLGEINFSDEFIIYKTKDTDYQKVGWNLNQINNNKSRFENSTVFFGSSYVLNGVNDSILNLNGVKSINLAIKHNGVELNLFFLERIAELKPKEVIFLKAKGAFGNLHKLSPLLHKTSSLINYDQSINFHLLKHAFKRAKLSLEFLFFQKPNFDYDLYSEKYGVRYEKNLVDSDIFKNPKKIELLKLENESFNLFQNEFLYSNEQNKKYIGLSFKKMKRELTHKLVVKNNWLSNNISQEKFVVSAKNICKKNNIQFSQIYLPVVADVVSPDITKQNHFWKLDSDSNIIYYFDDYSFLKNSSFWADKHHLSKNGSIIYSKKLTQKIISN